MSEYMSYVGLKACGCCVAAAVDSPEWQEDTAKFVADLVAGGLVVERKTTEWVRENMKGCKCPTRINR